MDCEKKLGFGTQMFKIKLKHFCYLVKYSCVLEVKLNLLGIALISLDMRCY